MARGRFITFEGGEGAGKSTQVRLLADQLRAHAFEVVLTREPGGTPFAESVRDFIFSGQGASGSALAEALLFSAARSDHLERLIRPRLAEGCWVLSDRFSDSTLAYQGAAGGAPGSTLIALDRLVVGPTTPDLTIILDLPPQDGLRRAEERAVASSKPGRSSDPIGHRDLTFHRRLREGFLAIADANPERCVVADGTASIAAISELVWQTVARRFLEARRGDV